MSCFFYSEVDTQETEAIFLHVCFLFLFPFILLCALGYYYVPGRRLSLAVESNNFFFADDSYADSDAYSPELLSCITLLSGSVTHNNYSASQSTRKR